MNAGLYYIDLFVIKDTSVLLYKFENILSFEIQEETAARPGKWYGKYPGVVRPFLEWETEFLEG